MRRNLMLAVVLGVVTGCVWHALTQQSDLAAAEPSAATKATFVHMVVFYLKSDAPAGEVSALVEDAHKLLAKVPSVRDLRIGKPAEKGTPDVAVKDYHLGLLVLFDNDKGLQEYLEHPLHQQYVEKHLKHVDKILVYDFMQQPAK